MRNYWTCSKFADWLRGSPKGNSKSSRGWYEWKKAAKQSHPIRYWLAEEGLDTLQDIIMWIPDRLYDAKYYINNRWVTKSHQLTAHPRDIKPGSWCDVGNRFLPCLFNELVDFVEIEQAWLNVAWDEKAREKYKTPWWGVGWFRWRTWRNPQAGLDYLDWSASLKNDEECYKDTEHYMKPTYQALAAMEIKELYHWWTKIRPLRSDPYDASGWSKICETRQNTHVEDGFLWEDRTPEEKAESSVALSALHQLEKQYEDEDEAMMIRLIKIRQSLWT